MALEDFHRTFLSDLRETVRERAADEREEFPSEELVHAEMMMEHLAAAGVCEEASVCHWSGTISRARTRISGFSLSSDETRLDLFITAYDGSDALKKASKTDLQAVATQGWRFIGEAAGGTLSKLVEPSHPVNELIALIRARWASLDQVRLIVMTDLQSEAKHFPAREAAGKLVSIEVVDIERLERHMTGRAIDEVSVSFEQTLGKPLPCVHVPEPDSDYDYALAAFPGEILRSLYERYSSRLLEANVRTFLGAGRAVNKGIATTLKTEPAHFMAFNNGLVLVCEEAQFSRCEDGSMGISLLKGVQIVNGGQTSSSIYFTARENRGLDLSRVRVPAKIIIPRQADAEARETLISNVSRFANSQNAVRTSDLSANRPFHVQLEKLANETWCPDGVSRWFYERAAGAYQVMLLREGTEARKRKLREAIPASRKFTKNEVAMYLEAWRGKPAQVALAGEKNFKAFMEALDNAPDLVPQPLDAAWYRALVGKTILFRGISSAIKRKHLNHVFTQGYINIATYTVSVLADRYGDRLCFETIWQKQALSPALEAMLVEWATVVNQVFHVRGPGRQISEFAKRPELWEHVRAADYPAPAGPVPELKPRG